MLSRCLIPMSAVLLAIAGCDEHRYEITMRQAADGAVMREVRYSVHESGNAMRKRVSAPEHLQQIYGGSAEEARTHSFSRSIRDSIPSDMRIGNLANHGSITTSESPLGTVHSYRERAPGPTRPWNMVKGLERIVDLTISAWLGYAATTPELRAEPEKLHALEAFLRGPVHDDALDLALMVWHDWLYQARAKSLRRVPDFEHELGARITLFLQERGYLDEQTTSMTDPIVLVNGFDALLRRIHIELGGAPDEPLSPALAKLSDWNETSNAFKAGLCAIGISEEKFDRSVQEAFAFSVFGNTLTAKIRWVGRPKPIESNGNWNADTGELTWESGAVDVPLLPDVLYAIWAQPNEEEQRRRFGATVLRSNLPEYNDWYRTLSGRQQAEWEEFLSGLTPDSKLEQRLRQYVAQYEPPHAAKKTEDGLRLSYGATILLDELTAAKRGESPDR